MNGHGKKIIKIIKYIFGAIVVGVFLYLAFQWLNVELLKAGIFFFIQNPKWLLVLTVVYSFSFLLRAYAWHLYVNKRISFRLCIHALWFSMFFNHLLPIKVGDGIRILFGMKSKNVTLDESTHSVVVLRTLDLLVLLVFSGIGFFYLYGRISTRIFLVISIFLIVALGTLFFFSKLRSQFFQKHIQMVKSVFRTRIGIWVLLLTTLSWICEGIVVFVVSHAYGLNLGYIASVYTNSITVAGQVFQILPGGVGTYETIMSTMLVLQKIDGAVAFQIAIISHSFKFLFSYSVGIYSIFRSPIRWKELKISKGGGIS